MSLWIVTRVESDREIHGRDGAQTSGTADQRRHREEGFDRLKVNV